MEEVQRAPGGDVTKTWELANVATDWMAWGQGAPRPRVRGRGVLRGAPRLRAALP